MQVIDNHSNNYYSDKKNSVISIGSFDGLHIAHNQIIEKVIEISNNKNYNSIIFTFEEPPKNYFAKQKTKILNLKKEKISLIESKGIDYVYLQKFDLEFANQTAEDFISNILIKKLNLKTIIIGDDHRLGKDRSGDFENLSKLGQKLDFEIIQIPSVYVDGIRVSSTNIRKSLEKGDIETANKLLGYEYFLRGKVISGKQIGRKIGFPTANLLVNDEKLLPNIGVYAVKAEVLGKMYPAMCNIGYRPSINESNELTIEVHIINFSDYIYNQEIKLEFYAKIRNEMKFDGVDSLIEQLKLDKIYTSNYFSR